MRASVLIVDDSASARAVLARMVEDAPGLRLMGTAADPFIAAKRMREETPDVILLDLEMPRMDGLSFLRKLMAQHPVPVVVCSSLTEAGTPAFLAALEAGAVDVVAKPRADSGQALANSGELIVTALRSAAHARIPGRHKPPPARNYAQIKVEPRNDASVILPLGSAPKVRTEQIVCLGASTGGTEAIREILMELPADCPPMAIVQHMPENFTRAFARRLDSLCAPQVLEAQDGDEMRQGRVLIAPGNRHMLLLRQARNYIVRVVDGPPVSRHRPSVDVLFRSAVNAAGSNAGAILLTGMGNDGAQGMLEMHSCGSHTIAQDEATCIVFGMPHEAIARGAASAVLPLDKIAREIVAMKRNSAG